MLNLAATLGTQSDEDDSQHPITDAYTYTPQQHHLRLLEGHPDELDQRGMMSRPGRRTDSTTAYGDRVPSQNSLYDWSPANEADNEDELDQILAGLRREHPTTHPEILRVLGRSQLDSDRERIRYISNRLQDHQPSPSGPPEHSLRSTAILQSVRRHPRFFARSRDLSQRTQGDRDATSRSSQHSNLEGTPRQMPMQRLLDGRSSLDRERRGMLSRPDAYRRSYLDRASLSSPAVSPMLEHTIKYLSRIRHSNDINDSINYALDAGFLSKDNFCMQYTDFVTNTFTIPPPAETSWLTPGAVLSGCQHATSLAASISTGVPEANTTINRFRVIDNPATSTLPALPPPTRPWIANSYSSARSQTSQHMAQGLPTQTSPQDRWPVKVTIHSVDWENMSISATMEAYNVPSHPHSLQSALSSSNLATTTSSQQFTRTSSITTFLEGEILDFNTHTLLTESFKSSATNDATYWRKLPPFQKMRDEEIVRALVSKKWFTEVLSKDWILMRWKERCFVKSLNKSTADPVQPPHSTTMPFADGPAHDSFLSSTSSIENHYYPSTYASQLQPSPYRIVRNQQTGRAEVEVAPLLNTSNGPDRDHATFDDSSCGLTISGFYYVCLRRSDGKLEGLYYDPQSSPYQCLKLDSVKGGSFPAWGFR